MRERRGARCQGFTLIELLIVVAIIGLIAAIVVPALVGSVQKARQKRTMASMRDVGLALGSYWTDQAGAGAAGASMISVSDWQQEASVDQLVELLVPKHIAYFPEQDGWSFNLEYRITLSQTPTLYYALIRSPGSDGQFDNDTYPIGTFPVLEYEHDIVWADGGFVQAPKTAGGGGGS